MTKEAVLIFGTFNPVTNAHLALGKKMHEVRPQADIIYIPASQKFLRGWKQFDDADVLPDDDRVRLLKEATKSYGFFVDSLEVTGIVDGVTYNTINYFKEKYENVFVCMGMDKLNELHKWRHSNELIADNKFLICTRDNKHINMIASCEVLAAIDNFTEIELDSDTQGISATQVREAWKAGELDTVKESIPSAVYEYLSRKYD